MWPTGEGFLAEPFPLWEVLALLFFECGRAVQNLEKCTTPQRRNPSVSLGSRHPCLRYSLSHSWRTVPRLDESRTFIFSANPLGKSKMSNSCYMDEKVEVHKQKNSAKITQQEQNRKWLPFWSLCSSKCTTRPQNNIASRTPGVSYFDLSHVFSKCLICVNDRPSRNIDLGVKETQL